MAQIYQKNTLLGTEQSLILGPKESYQAEFNVGIWTDLLVGMYISVTALSGSGQNDPYVFESLPYTASLKNNFFFGIKDNSTTFPGNSGTFFAGYMSDIVNTTYPTQIMYDAHDNSGVGSTPTYTIAQLAGTNSGVNNVWAALGTLFVSGGNVVESATIGDSYDPNSSAYLDNLRTLRIPSFTDSIGTSAFCMPFYIRYQVLNYGLSSQSIRQLVRVNTSNGTVTYPTDNASVVNLRMYMDAGWQEYGIFYNNSAHQYHNVVDTSINYSPSYIAYNNGSAVPLPNTVFIYNPFNNNGLRIHCICVERLS